MPPCAPPKAQAMLPGSRGGTVCTQFAAHSFEISTAAAGPRRDPCPCGACREWGQWCLVLGWSLSELELWGSSGPINPFIASRASLLL